MKRTLIALILVVIIHGYCFAQMDIGEGIRGFKWGVTIDNFPKLTFLFDSANLKTYQNHEEEKKIGDADVSVISYQFYKDSFCGVFIKFEGYNNFKYLKEALFQKYGSGAKKNRFIEDYQWNPKKTFIQLKYNETRQTGSIQYLYTPILQEKVDNDKEAAKKAKDGL